MDSKQKILVCGDVRGKFKTLFSRVNAINEKNGPFDFLFCVGDFFGESLSSWEPYKNGSIKVQVPTYILGPNNEEHVPLYNDLNGCELCNNVNYLGKRGLLSSAGLSIAYMSGLEGTSGKASNFTKKDVQDLKDIVVRSKIAGSTFLGVDILLTSVWPKGVTNHDDKSAVTGLSNRVSEQIAWLATQLRPRYHFAGLENIYYERRPYENYPNNESSVHCTRFIALAPVGSTGKNKWLYAASMTPIDTMKPKELYQVTTDQTPCPFLKFEDGSSNKQYFYDMNAMEDMKGKRKREGNDFQKKRQNIDQDSCWFCLASANVEKHLVISVGEQVYLALAKGGINAYHAMILPIQHHRSFAYVTEDIRDEVNRFKSALKKLFKSLKMVPIYFERNFKTSHMQIHVVPVPKSVKDKLLLAFQTGAEEQGIELTEMTQYCKLEETAKVDSPYFYVELPTNERLFCSCKKNFPLEFARDVLAGENILDLPDRVSWRDCVLPKNKEAEATEKFRSEFKPFDFTNDDDDDDD